MTATRGFPTTGTAIQLIDSATAAAYGGAGISAWTRVNDSVMNPANRIYTVSDPPAWIPSCRKSQNTVRVLLYLHELADMDLPGVAEPPTTGPAASLQVTPRPCRGVLQVGLPPGLGKRELRVHDVCGRLVARTAVPAGSPQAVARSARAATGSVLRLRGRCGHGTGRGRALTGLPASTRPDLSPCFFHLVLPTWFFPLDVTPLLKILS